VNNSLRLSIFLVCYFLCSTSTVAQSLESGNFTKTDRPTPTNIAGREVTDSNGSRITYLLEKPGIDLASKGTGGITKPIAREPMDSGYPRPSQTLVNRSTTAGLAPETIIETWRTGVMGNVLGVAGVVVADIDGDGTTEVLSAGSTSTFGSDQFWYELEYHASTQDYQMSWISGPEDSGIHVLTTMEAESDGKQILLGLGSGDVRVVSGISRQQIGLIETGGGAVNQIVVADADNDGNDEIVVCDDSQIHLADPVTLTVETHLPYGANDCEVGDVDEDAAIEIILSDGRVLQFDGIDTTLEWTYPGGEFGALLELADIDDDPTMEIIGASAWYFITAFDASLQTPLWQIPTSQDVDALLMADVTGDDRVELLYGDGQWGSVYAFDTRTVTEIWHIDNPEHGVGSIAVGDSDDDGQLELLYSSGYSSSGRDQLAVHGLPTTAFEWQSLHLDGPFNALTIGDSNGNGYIEDVIASYESNSGYDDGIVQILDSVRNSLQWSSQSNTFGDTAWTGLHDVVIGDVDNDGNIEFVVATGQLYDGAIYVFDGASRQIEAQYVYDEGATIYSLAIADVDNDGANEIIAGGGREHTGATGVYVYVIDGATGTVEWRSISLGEYWSSIEQIVVADIDSDDTLEIIALNDSLYVIDGISHVQWQSTQTGFTSIDAFDVSGDDRPEILAGNNSGQLIALDGITHDEVFNHASGSFDAIPGLEAFRIATDTAAQLAYTQSGQLKIFDLSSEATVFQSDVLGNVAGGGNGLALLYRNDSRFEILVGTDYSIHQFTVPDGNLIFSDGFE